MEGTEISNITLPPLQKFPSSSISTWYFYEHIESEKIEVIVLRRGEITEGWFGWENDWQEINGGETFDISG